VDVGERDGGLKLGYGGAFAANCVTKWNALDEEPRLTSAIATESNLKEAAFVGGGLEKGLRDRKGLSQTSGRLVSSTSRSSRCPQWYEALRGTTTTRMERIEQLVAHTRRREVLRTARVGRRGDEIGLAPPVAAGA